MVYCRSQKCLIGKTAIITGANTGIGYTTAIDLAKRGCHVILACRNQEKALNARNNIVSITGNENIAVKQLDLESLDSVRKFAEDIIATEERLDVLVNNAGAIGLPDKITADGLQLEMATNYFSHFLLTILLLDLLKKSAPSRVVNVSSGMAKLICSLKLDKLNKHNGDIGLYSKTKLCNIYFTQELARRLEGTNVTTYSLHPGAVYTEINRSSTFFNYIGSKLFKSAEEGAQTTIYLSVEDGIEKHNGQHFVNCKVVKPYSNTKDEKKAKKLWELTEQMVGLIN